MLHRSMVCGRMAVRWTVLVECSSTQVCNSSWSAVMTVACVGTISTANGSSLVAMGDTTVVCGVKAVGGGWKSVL